MTHGLHTVQWKRMLRSHCSPRLGAVIWVLHAAHYKHLTHNTIHRVEAWDKITWSIFKEVGEQYAWLWLVFDVICHQSSNWTWTATLMTFYDVLMIHHSDFWLVISSTTSWDSVDTKSTLFSPPSVWTLNVTLYDIVDRSLSVQISLT